MTNVSNAKDIPALKAVSQNLMHENSSITDGVYGILSEIDVKRQITTFRNNETSDDLRDSDELITLLETMISKFKALQNTSLQGPVK